MTDNSRVRVSIVGVIVVALFGALLARLWFLQVGESEGFQVRTEQRALRVLQTESPRGEILDALGRKLVTNRVVWSLTMSRDEPPRTRKAVFGRLAELLGGKNTPVSLEKRFTDVRQSPLRPALIVVETPEVARVTILEHLRDFPGIAVHERTVRSYPNGQLAAQVLGYVGEITGEELAKRKGYVNGDSIGRSGIEAAYEKRLRGKPRRDTYEVDPTGRPVGDPVKTRPGTVGDNVQLSVNLDVQRVAEQKLAEALVKARTRKNTSVEDHYETFKAPAGAVVVLDAQTGAVVAMASYPTYDPAKFIGGITQTDWDYYNSDASEHPLTNRATQGLYAPGSTFKLVTALAATGDGVRAPTDWITDNGVIQIGADKRSFHNAGNKAHGRVDLQHALTVSSDVYFYGLGYDFWKIWNGGDPARGYGIQRTAREFGFGAKTGIELSEATGRVPDHQWKTDFVKALYPITKEHPENKQKQIDNSRWYPGDNVNLAVGQGDLVVTPLQLADAYAAFANGGTLLTPHLAATVNDPTTKKVVERVKPKAIRRLQFDPMTYSAVMNGFVGAVDDPDGTAYPAFTGFPLGFVPVAGKTGTAQVQAVNSDTSLFAGFFPANNPKYVIATVVEQAGFGSEVAAPVTRSVIEQLAGLPVGPLDIKDTSNVGD
jgi:penicillin-binding protein 2